MFYFAFITELEKISGIGGAPAGTWKPENRGAGAKLLKGMRQKSPRRARELLAQKKGSSEFIDSGTVRKNLQRRVEVQKRLAHRQGERMTPSKTRAVQNTYKKAYGGGIVAGGG